MDNKLNTHGSIRPGEVWYDTNGDVIQAHGGGILYHNNVYYWYGENKSGPTADARCDVIGVSCYSSTDLVHWSHEGIVLAAEPSDPRHDLHPGNVLERPKVLYNKADDRFVMWFHVDSADYSYARAGVAVSRNPAGPFQYLGSFRPGGAMSRDMTVFRDSDDKAYLLCSSENNSTLYIFLLSDDYLKTSENYSRHFINRYREAPAIFKDNGKYYLITSGCTGWDPNEAEYAVADHMMGHWTVKGTPCTGPYADTTFAAQSTYILPVQGLPGAYIFMADRWNREDLGDSRYIWLPLQVNDGEITISWQDEWEIGALGGGKR